MTKLASPAFSSLLFVLLCTNGFAECPERLPEKPSPNELRDCFDEIGKLKKKLSEDLQAQKEAQAAQAAQIVQLEKEASVLRGRLEATEPPLKTCQVHWESHFHDTVIVPKFFSLEQCRVLLSKKVEATGLVDVGLPFRVGCMDANGVITWGGYQVNNDPGFMQQGNSCGW
jgi:hypothetical protein